MSISAITSPPSSTSTVTSVGTDSSTEDTGFLAVFTAESSRSSGAANTLGKSIKNPFSANQSDIDTTIGSPQELAEILEIVEQLAPSDEDLSLLGSQPTDSVGSTPEQVAVVPFDFLTWAENARIQSTPQELIHEASPEDGIEVPDLPNDALTSAAQPTVAQSASSQAASNVANIVPQTVPTKMSAPEIASAAQAPNATALPTTLAEHSPANGQNLTKAEDILSQRKTSARKDFMHSNFAAPDKNMPNPLALLKNAQWLIHSDAASFEKNSPLDLNQSVQNLENLTHSTISTRGSAAESRITVPIAPASPNLESIQGKTQEALKWMINQRVQSAEIRLNPEDLGPISVRLRLEGTETIVAFYAHHEPTRQLLEQSVHLLKEQLQNSGMTVADSFVGENADQSSFENFHRRGNSQFQGNDATGSAELDEELVENSATKQSTTSSNGRVDIFA